MASSIGYTLRLKDPNFFDLPAALDEAESHGVDSVEIPILDMNLIANGEVIEAQQARLLAMCEGRSLGYTAHAAIGLNFADEAWRLPIHHAVAEASLDISAALGARNMVIHTGKIPFAEAASIETVYARQRDALKRLGDHAAKRNVMVCVENIFSFDNQHHTASPSRLAEEIALIDHPFIAATLDVSHAFLSCGMSGTDYLSETAALAPYARHVHMHDSFGKPRRMFCKTEAEALAFGVGDLHMAVGTGSIPFDDLLARCTFPDNVVLNIELKDLFWPELSHAIAETRRLQAKVRTVSSVSSAA